MQPALRQLNISPRRGLEEQRRILNQELQCLLCNGMLVRPVTLSCGHTFCKHCLQVHMLKSGLECYRCHQVIYVPPRDLNVNEVLDGVLQKLDAANY